MNNASLNLQCLIVDFIRFRMTNDSFRVLYFSKKKIIIFRVIYTYMWKTNKIKMFYVDIIFENDLYGFPIDLMMVWHGYRAGEDFIFLFTDCAISSRISSDVHKYCKLICNNCERSDHWNQLVVLIQTVHNELIVGNFKFIYLSIDF